MLLEASDDPAAAGFDARAEPHHIILTRFSELMRLFFHFRDLLLAGRRQVFLVLLETFRNAPPARLNVLAELLHIIGAGPPLLVLPWPALRQGRDRA